jgi:hypothetical protein
LADGEEEDEEEEAEAPKPWGEYAATANVKPTWDCQSIVSTYSIADNHPSRISLDGSNANNEGKRRPASRFGGGASNMPSSIQTSTIQEETVLEEVDEEQEHEGDNSDVDPADDGNDGEDDGYSVVSHGHWRFVVIFCMPSFASS